MSQAPISQPLKKLLFGGQNKVRHIRPFASQAVWRDIRGQYSLDSYCFNLDIVSKVPYRRTPNGITHVEIVQKSVRGSFSLIKT
jgi:hypothetical protein